MNDKRQWVPVGGFLAIIAIVAYMVVQLQAQVATRGNYSDAAIAEVRDAAGQIVLRGEFAPAVEDDDDVERKATLQPTGIDPDASGEAEVEFAKATPANQEIEFSIQNVEPGATFTCVIDGQDVATVTADRRGRAEVEFDVRSR